MKKIILLFTLCFPIFLSAQLVSEDFESYTVGAFDGQWDAANWVGWFGGASNTEISDEQFLSGSNSLKVEANDDVVALLGTLDSEGYEVVFHQYIPSGNGAYFNLQHAYTNSAGSWMSEAYFTPDGVAQFNTNGQAIQFTAVYDQWVEHKFTFNFITGMAQYVYNDTPVADFFIIATSNGAGVGPNSLNAINFFGTCAPAGCNSLAYYDDILVTFIPAPPHNARVINPVPPSEYTTVPDGLQQPITLQADVWNIGAQDITDVSVTFTLKDGSGATVYTETTDPVSTISSTEQTTFVGAGPFTLSGVDNFTMDYQVNIAETDDDPADNLATVQVPFAIDENIYARDDGNYVGGGIAVAGQTAILGQSFDFVDMASVQGILVAYEASASGELVRGLIYSLDDMGIPDTIVAATDTITIDEAGAAGMPVFLTLEFPDDVVVMPGKYMFAVEQIGTASMNLSFSVSVFTAGETWAGLLDANGALVWNNLEVFNLPVAMAVRPLISLVGVGVDESAVNYVNALKISPNPTQDVITIDLELLETQDLSVEVFNINGQRIKSMSDQNTIGGQYQLDLEPFPSGIYFVKFQIGEQVLSRRVVLTK